MRLIPRTDGLTLVASRAYIVVPQNCLCCPDGETEAEAPPIFEKGACHQLVRFIPLAQEGTAAQELQCLVSSHSVRHKEEPQLGHLAA